MRITIQTAIFTLKNKNMCAVWHTKRRLNLNFPISFSNQLTFAAAETESQFPPAKVNLPSPIRDRISLGVSFGPFANGVCLQKCQFIYMPIFQILQSQMVVMATNGQSNREGCPNIRVQCPQFELLLQHIFITSSRIFSDKDLKWLHFGVNVLRKYRYKVFGFHHSDVVYTKMLILKKKNKL